MRIIVNCTNGGASHSMVTISTVFPSFMSLRMLDLTPKRFTAQMLLEGTSVLDVKEYLAEREGEGDCKA